MKSLTAHRLREGLNALVRPQPVSVLDVEQVADDWHARFSCIGRRYLYRILNRRRAARARRGRVWHIAVPLDVEAMQRRRGACSIGTPRFHDLPLGPVPVGQSGEDARPAGGQPRRRGDPHRGGGAELPPPPGAVDGRLPGAGRARAMVAGRHAARRWKRATAPRSVSTPRRTGLYFVEAIYP